MCKLIKASLRRAHFYKVYTHTSIYIPLSHSLGPFYQYPCSHTVMYFFISYTYLQCYSLSYVSMQSSVDCFSVKTLLLTLQASFLLQVVVLVYINCSYIHQHVKIASLLHVAFARNLPSRLCSLRASSVLPLLSEDFTIDSFCKCQVCGGNQPF